ncbi:MAG: DUF169 domain-containing protein [Dehalococcoidia bacterium]
MKPAQTDLSIYGKLDSERAPVGVKFMLGKPEGIEQLDKTMALCEMPKEAQDRGTPFYITSENENCGGSFALGMVDPSPIGASGQVGPKYGIFQDARANRRITKEGPKLEKGSANYVAFSTLDKLPFDPDLLILVTTTSQAEIVMRAMSYSTGELWVSKISNVGACSWMFIYPYLEGKVNHTTTGMAFGMKARHTFPEGLSVISIPYQWIPTIAQNLQEMEWVLPAYRDTREEFFARDKKIMEELAQEFGNP